MTSPEPGLSAAVAERAAPPGRRRGRPRSAAVQEAAVIAAIDLLAEDGYTRMTMEGVATRARAAKTTIYRRWSSKLELVLDVVALWWDQVEVTVTGDARAELLSLYRSMSEVYTTTRVGHALAAVIAEVGRNPELADTVRQALIYPRRQQAIDVLLRGMERGDIRALDHPEDTVDLLLGLIYYRMFVVGYPPRPEDGERIIDTLLQGVGRAE